MIHIDEDNRHGNGTWSPIPRKSCCRPLIFSSVTRPFFRVKPGPETEYQT